MQIIVQISSNRNGILSLERTLSAKNFKNSKQTFLFPPYFEAEKAPTPNHSDLNLLFSSVQTHFATIAKFSSLMKPVFDRLTCKTAFFAFNLGVKISRIELVIFPWRKFIKILQSTSYRD